MTQPQAESDAQCAAELKKAMTESEKAARGEMAEANALYKSKTMAEREMSESGAAGPEAELVAASLSITASENDPVPSGPSLGKEVDRPDHKDLKNAAILLESLDQDTLNTLSSLAGFRLSSKSAPSLRSRNGRRSTRQRGQKASSNTGNPSSSLCGLFAKDKHKASLSIRLEEATS
ncbi:MAG: hypothetical protein Q9217_006805, partial [Psora testacea]